MSQVSRINGFRPVKSVVGTEYQGGFTTYFVPASDATAIFVGDLVKPVAGVRSATGIPVATRVAANTDAILGVVVGIAFEGVGDVTNMPQIANLNTPIYRAASTDCYIYVADDPSLILEAQVSNGTLVAANIGKNASPGLGAGSTVTGNSGFYVDQATAATTATLPLKILSVKNSVDNNISDPYVRVLVSINNHVFKGGTGTAGV